MENSKTQFAPGKWFVTISATDAVTGIVFPIAHHQCESRAHGRQLLTELRELAADIAGLVPGLSVAGYELAEAVEVPSSLAALGAALPAGRSARWWAEAIGAFLPSE